MRTVRSLWFASATTRVAVLDGRSADTADYNPRSAGRDAPLSAREHLDDTGGGSEDDDDEANELAAIEALQGYDSSSSSSRVATAALTALVSVGSVALTLGTALLMILLPVTAAFAANDALRVKAHGHRSDGGEVAKCSGGEQWLRSRSEHCSTAHGS
jgi:hypothetical protein